MTQALERDLFTIPDIAYKERVGVRFIWAEIAAGRLKAVKVGRLTRVSQEALDAWLKALPPVVDEEAAAL